VFLKTPLESLTDSHEFSGTWSISNEVAAFEGDQTLKFSAETNQIFVMAITDGAQAVNIDNFSHLSISVSQHLRNNLTFANIY
jgi:hypothetical protein